MATRAEAELLIDAPINLSTQQEVPTLAGPAFTQVRGVPIFSGRQSKMGIDDWIRDLEYFFSSSRTPPSLQFSTIVRNLSGEAHRLVLNLAYEEQTPKAAFNELRAEYGDAPTDDPFAAFYEQMQRTGESAQSYTIALQSLFTRIADDYPQGQGECFLVNQFMRGLRDEELRLRLAPMRPRTMSFWGLREEVRRFMWGRQGKTRRPAGSFAHAAATPDHTEDTRARLLQISKSSEDTLSLLKEVVATQRRTTERVAALEGRLEALELASSSPKGSVGQCQECWECGQTGHWRRNCPTRMAPGESAALQGRRDALHQAQQLNG
ncbi:uncharacterized protein [Diadema antillarum]|uniref:uncharacterized protein n=1 Tax=Diadema antillarum TaxID=105358 RepID=UPI003A874FDD